ncbi:MAG TPA: DICT sensory domain-containing protein, partial [Phormidium sp.]
MDISLFRSIASQYQDLRSVHSLATMNVISHLIEDQILNHKLTVDLYAGFQRFSDFSEQLPRYMRLGDMCRRVFVFGVADIQPPSIPGIEFIELSPTSALGRERFLLVNTS